MNLPGKKTVWDGSIILFATAVILLAITFVKKFETHVQHADWPVLLYHFNLLLFWD